MSYGKCKVYGAFNASGEVTINAPNPGPLRHHATPTEPTSTYNKSLTKKD